MEGTTRTSRSARGKTLVLILGILAVQLASWGAAQADCLCKYTCVNVQCSGKGCSKDLAGCVSAGTAGCAATACNGVQTTECTQPWDPNAPSPRCIGTCVDGTSFNTVSTDLLDCVNDGATFCVGHNGVRTSDFTQSLPPSSVPTLSEWGMIALVLFVLMAGVFVLVKQRIFPRVA